MEKLSLEQVTAEIIRAFAPLQCYVTHIDYTPKVKIEVLDSHGDNMFHMPVLVVTDYNAPGPLANLLEQFRDVVERKGAQLDPWIAPAKP